MHSGGFVGDRKGKPSLVAAAVGTLPSAWRPVSERPEAAGLQLPPPPGILE